MRNFVVLLILMTVLISGCAANDHEKKVVMLMSSLENPFFEEIATYAELMADIEHIDLIILDSENDIKKEWENYQSQEAIEMLIINPVNSSLSSAVVEDANEKNIPVVSLDREITKGEVLSHITSDSYMGGQMAGTFLKALYTPDKRVILIEGIEGTTVNDLRVEGFMDQMLAESIHVNDILYGDFNREKTKEILKPYDLDSDCIVFATNDEMALGAVDMMLEKEIYMVVIGFDGTKSAIDAVGTGFLAGTIAQQPDMFAKYCIEAVKKNRKNETLKKEILIGLKMISIKEN